PVVDDAFARAELAFDFPVGLFLVELGFLDELRVVLGGRSSEDGDSIVPDNRSGAGGEAGKGSSLQKSSPVEGEAAGFLGANSPRRLEELQIIFHRTSASGFQIPRAAIRLPPRDSRFQIQDSRFRIQNSKSCGPFFVAIRLPSRDSRFRIQDSRFQIQNSKSCHQTSTSLNLWGSLVPRACCGSAAVEM